MISITSLVANMVPPPAHSSKPAASHGRAPPLKKGPVPGVAKGKAGSSKDRGGSGSDSIPPPKKTRQGQPNMDNYV